jgi:hypothetical protein
MLETDEERELRFKNWLAEEIIQIRTGIQLRRPSNYQSLFKYVSLNSEISWDYLHKTLWNAELLGSDSTALNDPFELSPYIFDDLAPGTIAKSINRIDLSFLGDRPSLPVTEIFSDSEPFRQRARSYLEQIFDRTRIVAFCERVDSSLLWSHYANSYKGACLHFVAAGFSRSDALGHYTLGKVSYSKNRPPYPLSLALALSSRRHEGRAISDKILFFTKAEEWAYETEVRLVYDVKYRQAADFERDSFVSIILGPRFTDENRRRLDSLLKGSLYENISIRRARLSKTTFSIEIDE